MKVFSPNGNCTKIRYVLFRQQFFRYLYAINHMTEFRNDQYPVLIAVLSEIYILNKQLQMLT